MRRLVIYLCYFMMMWTLVSRSPSFGRTVTDLSVEEVPPKRLLDNLQAYLKRHPRDAEAHYELGRVYSVLYISNKKTISAAFKTLDDKPLSFGIFFNNSPEYARYPVYPGFSIHEPSLSEQERFVGLSLAYYKEALELAERTKIKSLESQDRCPLYLLGYAWMLEKGIQFAKTLPAPFKAKRGLATEQEWRDKATDILREVYRNYRPSLQEIQNTLSNHPMAAQEAAEGIVRLQRSSKNPQVQKEVALVRQWLDSVDKLHRFMSPIIFPLNGHDTLSQLLAPRKAVRFDLMGDRTGTRWSWVNERAGILVWDPLHNGRVRSGYQLFGNVTWCMIWKHGYAPLARLDANGDGWLTGRELEGIAVWRDKNGNGVSDRGEVIPLSRLGIARISVKALQGGDGVFWNPKGIVKRDGTAVPTYDWIAKEAK